VVKRTEENAMPVRKLSGNSS